MTYEDMIVKAVSDMLPSSMPYDEWCKLNHWFRMQAFVPRSPLHVFSDMMFEAVQSIEKEDAEAAIDVARFVKHPTIQGILAKFVDLLKEMGDGGPLARGNEVAHWHFYTIMKLRGVVYSVAPTLAKLLNLTELHDVETDLIHCPHQVMYVQIPPSAGLRVWERRTEWHPVEGVYLVEAERPYDREHFDERGEPWPDHAVEGQPYREIRMMIVGASKNKNIWDDANLSFRIRLDLPTVEQCLQSEIEVTQRLWTRGHRQAISEAILSNFRFVLNVLLYCTSVDADIVTKVNPKWDTLNSRLAKARSGKKRQRIKAERDRHPRRQVRVVGSQVVIEGRAPWREDSPNGSSSHGSGRKIEVHRWVRGHYKGVWRGSEDIERAKTIGPRRKVPKWVKPYERGKDMAEALHRNYAIRLPR